MVSLSNHERTALDKLWANRTVNYWRTLAHPPVPFDHSGPHPVIPAPPHHCYENSRKSPFAATLMAKSDRLLKLWVRGFGASFLDRPYQGNGLDYKAENERPLPSRAGALSVVGWRAVSARAELRICRRLTRFIRWIQTASRTAVANFARSTTAIHPVNTAR